jgi:uncharacterized membrane protein YeiH
VSIPYYIDLIGVMVFAISGAMAAFDKRMYSDLFSLTFVAFITSVGGGTLRDIILDAHPIYWVRDGNFLMAIVTGVLITIAFKKWLFRLTKTIFLFDTVGMAIYTIYGLEKSLAYQVSIPAAVVLGMFTGVMGGVIRDTLLNETPLIFKKEIYATACLAGALVFVVLMYLGVEGSVNGLISITTIILLRVVAVRYNLSLPPISKRKN